MVNFIKNGNIIKIIQNSDTEIIESIGDERLSLSFFLNNVEQFLTHYLTFFEDDSNIKIFKKLKSLLTLKITNEKFTIYINEYILKGVQCTTWYVQFLNWYFSKKNYTESHQLQIINSVDNNYLLQRYQNNNNFVLYKNRQTEYKMSLLVCSNEYLKRLKIFNLKLCNIHTLFIDKKNIDIFVDHKKSTLFVISIDLLDGFFTQNKEFFSNKYFEFIYWYLDSNFSYNFDVFFKKFKICVKIKFFVDDTFGSFLNYTIGNYKLCAKIMFLKSFIDIKVYNSVLTLNQNFNAIVKNGISKWNILGENLPILFTKKNNHNNELESIDQNFYINFMRIFIKNKSGEIFLKNYIDWSLQEKENQQQIKTKSYFKNLFIYKKINENVEFSIIDMITKELIIDMDYNNISNIKKFLKNQQCFICLDETSNKCVYTVCCAKPLCLKCISKIIDIKIKLVEKILTCLLIKCPYCNSKDFIMDTLKTITHVFQKDLFKNVIKNENHKIFVLVNPPENINTLLGEIFNTIKKKYFTCSFRNFKITSSAKFLKYFEKKEHDVYFVLMNTLDFLSETFDFEFFNNSFGESDIYKLDSFDIIYFYTSETTINETLILNSFVLMTDNEYLKNIDAGKYLSAIILFLQKMNNDLIVSYIFGKKSIFLQFLKQFFYNLTMTNNKLEKIYIIP